jgi:uncharacterized membrane protein
MSDPRLPRLVYACLMIAAVLTIGYYYPQMPQRMAAHFDINGRPNGWQPREMFFLLMVVVIGTSAIVGFVAPRQMMRKPPERWNLPNREYWLSPEHRQETQNYISSLMLWFACGLAFVLITGTALACRANLQNGPFDSTSMLYLVVGLTVFIGILLVAMIRRFQNVPNKQN